MLANDITRDRLRRLAEARVGDAKVLSVFLNLDPREFATPAARSTEVRSRLDRAGRLVREESERLTHEQKESLRADLERVAGELGNGAGTKGAHGLAIFSASAAGLFEMLRLSKPVDHDPVIADAPYLAPLSLIGAAEWWCVVLVNRRSGRLFCGSSDALEEIELIDDGVRNRHDQGGWSQANYQRSIDKDVQDHLKHVAEVVFTRMKRHLPEGVLVGRPAGDAVRLRAHAPPVPARAPHGPHRHRRREQLARGRAPRRRRSASRPPGASATTRRSSASPRPSARTGAPPAGCPTCSSPSTSSASRRCSSTRATRRPASCARSAAGSAARASRSARPTARRSSATTTSSRWSIERAITQSAGVHILRDRPELASHGHIAALLRF